MNQKKIYLTTEKWWEDRKKFLNDDLANARNFTTDPDIVRLMQELLQKTKINMVGGE